MIAKLWQVIFVKDLKLMLSSCVNAFHNAMLLVIPVRIGLYQNGETRVSTKGGFYWQRSVARYYDTHSGRFIGEQPRLCQTWTVSGFLTFKDDFREPREGILVFMGRGL